MFEEDDNFPLEYRGSLTGDSRWIPEWITNDLIAYSCECPTCNPDRHKENCSCDWCLPGEWDVCYSE